MGYRAYLADARYTPFERRGEWWRCVLAGDESCLGTPVAADTGESWRELAWMCCWSLKIAMVLNGCDDERKRLMGTQNLRSKHRISPGPLPTKKKKKKKTTANPTRAARKKQSSSEG